MANGKPPRKSLEVVAKRLARPWISYTEEIGKELYQLLSVPGVFLDDVLDNRDDLPSAPAVRGWGNNPSHPFYLPYQLAMRARMDALSQEVERLAKSPGNSFDEVAQARVSADILVRLLGQYAKWKHVDLSPVLELGQKPVDPFEGWKLQNLTDEEFETLQRLHEKCR